jgi:Pectate lyase superfamily protein/SMP-30/Gluconolactonase/LRE-like region
LRSLASLILLLGVMPAWATSYYTIRLDDPRAVYLTHDEFGVRGDGVADDTEAIQKAIDRVQEATGQGVLFIPEGRYRLTRTLYIWPGIRLIGYGAKRPVLVLGDHTPGFQNAPAYMVFFAGSRPGHGGPFARGFRFRNPTAEEREEVERELARSPYRPPRDTVNAKPPDANPGTFYSAMSNIDIEIGEGNPAAAAVRARYAQHCFLAHMDFHIGSGLAGIHDGGNLAEDVHFYGGQYGIITRKPSPGWQFTLVDATFEGQREAAIKEHEAGLTLIRPHFKNLPAAISIDPGYADELWVKDGLMENVAGPAVTISNEKNFRTEINLKNIVCDHTPVFALFRESGRNLEAPGDIYRVRAFSHGLHFSDMGDTPQIRTQFGASKIASLPPPVKSDVPDLPARDTWVNVQSLGAKGDGTTDDTDAFRKAIATHRTIFLPIGAYLISDTLTLKPDTVLIGLHPSATRLFLRDSTPAFQGVGDPKPMVEAPAGGTNIITGIGLYANGINPRALALKWMAGTNSLVNDVRFLGGHGTSDLNGRQTDIYNNTHTADPDLLRKWDSQYPSLWVTNGGGGTFMDLWTPDTFAQAGLYISDTTTEGRIYQLSSEHHVRNEVKIRNASNWHIYALQTEEERGESTFALPLHIENSSNITFANFHLYRVVSSYQPFPYAVKIVNSRDIHFRNFHCYSDSKVSFDNAVYDQTHNVEIRQREFASLDVSGDGIQVASKSPPDKDSASIAFGEKLTKLAGGFFNISGAAVDPKGRVYFVDNHWQRIYRWSPEAKLELVRDSPLEPGNLVFDKAGDLMIVSYAGKGTVYSFRPDAPRDAITLLKPEPSTARPGLTPVLPVDVWRNENDFRQALLARNPYQFLSPDGSTFIPADEDFITGHLYYGAKMESILRAFGLAPVVPGRPFYISDENQQETYAATVSPDGTISDLKLFAERGGEAVTTDANGNVYIAAGQIFVYNPQGRKIDTIKVPERPLGLVFGEDGKTLFITARTSLYAVRPRFAGRS